MPKLTLASVVLTLLCLSATPNPAHAQTPDRREQMIEIAAWTDILTQYDTIYRLIEEMTFWQSVTAMGTEYDWTFEYNTSGQEVLPYTYRLRNIIESADIDAIRALQAIQRNRVAEPVHIENGEVLHAGSLEIHALSQRILDLLLVGDVETATTLFETDVIPLRRELANRSYSVSREIRETIRDMALDARLDR